MLADDNTTVLSVKKIESEGDSGYNEEKTKRRRGIEQFTRSIRRKENAVVTGERFKG